MVVQRLEMFQIHSLVWRRITKLLLIAPCALCLLSQSVCALPTESVYEVIVDLSKSMSAPIDGVRKTEMAATALRQSTQSILARSTIILRTIGSAAELECGSGIVESISNNQALDRYTKNMTSSVTGKKTPIARAITESGKDLQKYSTIQKHIILITDGIDTCGGNPIEAAQKLKDLDIHLKVHVVGIQLDPLKSKYMKSVSLAGGGKFVNANNDLQLNDALHQMVQVQQAIQNEEKVVVGGHAQAKATILDSNQFRVVAGSEQTYFYVPTKKAQAVQLDFDPTVIEQVFFDSNGTAILNAKKQYLDLSGDGCTFSLRSVGNDSVIAFGKIVELYDKTIGNESTRSQPLELPSNQTISAHIGLQDFEDYFILSSKDMGQNESVMNITFSAAVQCVIRVIDSSGEEVYRQSNSSSSATFTLSALFGPHALILQMDPSYALKQIVDYQILWSVE